MHICVKLATQDMKARGFNKKEAEVKNPKNRAETMHQKRPAI
jgi:hypothetical protein